MTRSIIVTVLALSALTGAAHADSSIYVMEIVGAERCQLNKDPHVRDLVRSSERRPPKPPFLLDFGRDRPPRPGL
jgi:hypothetical protein